MKAVIALATTTLLTLGAYAQGRGPFTDQETQLLSAVWPEIRAADEFDDIDWDTVGLNEAPGDSEARLLMERHWDELRDASDFEDIDWQDFSSADAFRDRGDGFESGPFSDWEARRMAEVWPRIRDAARYEDIDWDSVGLDEAPGDADARDVMAENWGTLRQAANFSDIDWRSVHSNH